MAKAKRYKEQRRQEQVVAQASQARRRHLYRWIGFLVVFVVAATIIFPMLYKNSGSDFLEKPILGIGKETNVNKPVAVITTDKGVITVELNRQKAPKTVDHITDLVKKGFYNGLTFHRVEPGFVIQGGDPTGDGTGGSGKTVKFEKNDLKHDKGVIALARSQDKNSGDSQFYITLAPQPGLDGEYVVFGKVTNGLDVVEKITKGDKMTSVTLQP